jgi:hypothetical protein
VKNIATMMCTALVLAGFARNAAAGPLEEAMRAAMRGPEKKKLKIFDHHFNVKPVERQQNTPKNGQVTAIGHLSHHLSGRSDDQIYYRIVKEGDRIILIDRQITRGGWAPIAAPIIAAAGTYLTGAPIPRGQVEAIGRSLGKAVDGSWEGAADFIIANVALRLHAPPFAAPAVPVKATPTKSNVASQGPRQTGSHLR